MIDPQDLAKHLKDYSELTGQTSDQFICPLTLEPCASDTLINGHILNARLNETSRRRVIQFGAIDHFYGTRVEPSLIRFFNLRRLSLADVLAASRELRMEFADGSTAPCFVTYGKQARAATDQFPTTTANLKDASVPVFVRVPRDDPRLRAPMQLAVAESFLPSHWVAAMLKAGVLALFDMIGYRAVLDPMGDAVRQPLARYFRDNGTRDQAAHYFREFHNSIRVLGLGTQPSDLGTKYAPVDFDTVSDRILLLHFAGTSMREIFAATCIFAIDTVTVTVSLPQMTDGQDAASAWRRYQALLRNDSDLVQTVHRAKYEGARWNVEIEPLRAHFGGAEQPSEASDELHDPC